MFICQQLAKHWAYKTDFFHGVRSYDGNGKYLCGFQQGILEVENTGVTNGYFLFFSHF